MLSKLACTLVFLLVAVSGAGQTVTPSARQNDPGSVSRPEEARFQVGIQGLVGVPVGDFADNVGTTGGIAADFGYRLGDSPISVGAVVGFLAQGGGTRHVPLSLTLPDVHVGVTTSTYMVMLHARVRVQPAAGRVRPYADALLGFNYLYTQTGFGLLETSTTDFSDFAPSAGGGGGVIVELHRWSDGRFGLALGAQYLYGGEAEYLVAGPEGFAAGVGSLETRRSRTDVLLVLLGGTVEF